MSSHRDEIEAGERFEFGANWSRFLSLLDESRIAAAEASLREMLRREDLRGLRFLDAGSGSGLFSLAARRLGATVYSFDYDPASVACTRELRRRFFPDDPQWTVTAGSVLDRAFLDALGRFDVVYSWGVLHHTGSMWAAVDNVARLVSAGGQFFLALYNDEGPMSRYWHRVKRAYVRHRLLRWPLILVHMPYPFLPSWLYRRVTKGGKGDRGMSFWYDVVDWVGGYPFEVASPEAVVEFLRPRGFRVDRLRTTNRLGCNEFVMLQSGQEPPCVG